MPDLINAGGGGGGEWALLELTDVLFMGEKRTKPYTLRM